METNIEPQKVKMELVAVYHKYLEDPECLETRKEIQRLCDLYDSSTSYSFFDASTEKAINYLAFLLQGGKHEYFTKERVLKEAEEILKGLNKN